MKNDVGNIRGKNMVIQTYAFKHNNQNVLLQSSSGGAFSAISDYVLDNDGVVYGAIYDYELHCVTHIKAESKSERNKMRGSKYIQSSMGNAFRGVGKDLEIGKKVLFTGTICQISGLKNYLKMKNINSEDLICCDIICHGTASPKVWKDFILMKKEELNIKNVESISFRDKTEGWSSSKTVLRADGKLYNIPEFMKLFYGHAIMRESCHVCHFTNTNRISDITIGDFWGIENCLPNFNSIGGVSFVMTNTQKGANIIQIIISQENADICKCDIKDVVQPNFYKATPRSVIRERLWKEYKIKGIRYIVSEYTSTSRVICFRVTLKKVVETIKKYIS